MNTPLYDSLQEFTRLCQMFEPNMTRQDCFSLWVLTEVNGMGGKANMLVRELCREDEVGPYKGERSDG